MLIHSIVSLSDIFCNTENACPPPEYRAVNGGIVEIEGGRVRRLISTDPAMYLDRRYMPYTKFPDKKEAGFPR